LNGLYWSLDRFKQYRFKPDQCELVDFDRNTRFAANAEPTPADAMVEFAAFRHAASQQPP
jgi:hypothetical protein